MVLYKILRLCAHNEWTVLLVATRFSDPGSDWPDPKPDLKKAGPGVGSAAQK